MTTDHVDVIATTVSGSIRDWKKVERIVPLFREHGFDDVLLHVVDDHAEARRRAHAVLQEGGRVLISAGGSGTFRNVLEGCLDSGAPLPRIRLGFLRKGSADLIGKTLDMPDDIEAAIAVFAESIRSGTTIPCDVLRAEAAEGDLSPRHFVGYGGAEIFGRIPHFTENRFMKWYKGILGLVFGDLGPFTTGMTLALAERMLQGPFGGRGRWRIRIDGRDVAENRYHALILVNGYLGRDLPFTSDPLGSGHFHLFALRDLGLRKLPRQVMQARSGAVMRDPDRWGMESFRVDQMIELAPAKAGPFPVNVDGSTLVCRRGMRVQIVDRIPLIAKRTGAAARFS
jgi:diacylglycerol kinase family enzyme